MNSLTRAFWKGRRVLITGHTGFKGAWLSQWLLRLGAEVSGFSKDVPTTPSLFEDLKLIRKMKSFEGDIRGLGAVLSAFRTAKPEVIFHLAAQSLVSRSSVDPLETISANVMGTANILETTRMTAGVQALVVVTSDKCYRPSASGISYQEHDALGGDDPYSASKACAEILTHSYQKSFSLQNIATARAGNVIGGGDWAANRLAPDLIRGWIAQKPVLVRHPDFVRPWQHVLDPLHGYLQLAQTLVENSKLGAGAWNFGPKMGNPVQEVCLAFSDILPKLNTEYLAPKSTKDSFCESPSILIDSSKSQTHLKWKQQWDFETAIRRTADWYLEHSQNVSAGILCERDLSAYESEIT